MIPTKTLLDGEKFERGNKGLLPGIELGHVGLLASRGLSIAPLTLVLVVHTGEVSIGHGDEVGQVVLVLWFHIGDGQASGGLHADNGTDTRLALDNAVWDTTSLAEGWEPHNHLNRVNIVGDDDQLGLLLLEGLGELVDCWWDFDTLQECHLAALETHILWPLHETGEVTLAREDVATDGKHTGLLLDRRARELNLRGGALGTLLHHSRNPH